MRVSNEITEVYQPLEPFSGLSFPSTPSSFTSYSFDAAEVGPGCTLRRAALFFLSNYRRIKSFSQNTLLSPEKAFSPGVPAERLSV